MTVLVTGATGFIGRHLIQRLLERSVPVRVVTRDLNRLPVEWRDRVEVIVGDLLGKRIQTAATKGVGLIYNLAGETRDSSLMRAINVETVHGLLETAAQVGVKRIVHLSSVGVIGAREAGVVTEETPCRPQTLYEQSKLEGEQIVLEYARSGRRVWRTTSMSGMWWRPCCDYRKFRSAGQRFILLRTPCRCLISWEQWLRP